MGGIAYVRKHEYAAMKAEIERLRAALREARQAINDYGLDDFEETTHETLAKIDAALGDEQAAQTYKWICEACGTLSNDQTCDCTKFDRPGKFIPFEAKRT